MRNQLRHRLLRIAVLVLIPIAPATWALGETSDLVTTHSAAGAASAFGRAGIERYWQHAHEGGGLTPMTRMNDAAEAVTTQSNPYSLSHGYGRAGGPAGLDRVQ